MCRRSGVRPTRGKIVGRAEGPSERFEETDNNAVLPHFEAALPHCPWVARPGEQ
jgi:hypothetical protein